MANTAKHRVPKNLHEALARGWRIDDELSSWQFNGSARREGLLLLKKPGGRNADMLTVPFSAVYAAERPYLTFGGKP